MLGAARAGARLASPGPVLSSPRGGAAPGGPGLQPTWSTSNKEMVGCSAGRSRLWFTIGGGILNEVYYPRVDIPQIRDLGFLVADGKGFWVEVKRLLAAHGRPPRTQPGFRRSHIVHRHARFQLTLTIVPGSERDAMLMDVGLTGDAELRLMRCFRRTSAARAETTMRDRRSPRPARPAGPAGPIRTGTRGCRWGAARRLGPCERRLRGDQRRMQDSRNGAMTWEYGWRVPATWRCSASCPGRVRSGSPSARAPKRLPRSRSRACSSRSRRPASVTSRDGEPGTRDRSCRPNTCRVSPPTASGSFKSRRWCCAFIRTRPIPARWSRA